MLFAETIEYEVLKFSAQIFAVGYIFNCPVTTFV